MASFDEVCGYVELCVSRLQRANGCIRNWHGYEERAREIIVRMQLYCAERCEMVDVVLHLLEYVS